MLSDGDDDIDCGVDGVDGDGVDGDGVDGTDMPSTYGGSIKGLGKRHTFNVVSCEPVMSKVVSGSIIGGPCGSGFIFCGVTIWKQLIGFA